MKTEVNEDHGHRWEARVDGTAGKPYHVTEMRLRHVGHSGGRGTPVRLALSGPTSYGRELADLFLDQCSRSMVLTSAHGGGLNRRINIHGAEPAEYFTFNRDGTTWEGVRFEAESWGFGSEGA